MSKTRNSRVRQLRDGTLVPARKGTPLSKAVFPVRMPNGPGVGTLVYGLGILCGMAISIYEVGANYGYPDVTVDIADHGGAILFFASYDRVGHVIDMATGGEGFSHCAIYPAVTNSEGEPLLVESRGGHGVVMTPVSRYDGYLVAWYPLTQEETMHVRGAALAMMGRPYRLRRGGVHCADLVYACMPPKLRREIRDSGVEVTPNGIAGALGICAESTCELPDVSTLSSRLQVKSPPGTKKRRS